MENPGKIVFVFGAENDISMASPSGDRPACASSNSFDAFRARCVAQQREQPRSFELSLVTACPPRSGGSVIRTHDSQHGFSLVELLVVIAIIAVLMGILLPVVTSARARSNTLKCQTQLRELFKGIQMYCAEYKGRLPYGEYDVPKTGTPQRRFLWCTLISHYLDRRFDQSLLSTITPDPEQFGKVFKCPDAPERSPLSYACHPVAMPWREFEEGLTIPGMPTSPTANVPYLISNLYNRNIVLFETGCSVSTTWFYPLGYSVDGGQLIRPDVPEYRYLRQSDPNGNDPNLGNNFPIIQEPGFTSTKKSNEDWSPAPPQLIPKYPWRGNVRFRHNLNKVGNFVFADGHVESLTAQDCKRNMWLLRWPSGLQSSDGINN
jgi:prepilin-type N-terminal cleavage/methylation domain-containing protein/prepilin-type processing-associated H-X9-DG protein